MRALVFLTPFAMPPLLLTLFALLILKAPEPLAVRLLMGVFAASVDGYDHSVVVVVVQLTARFLWLPDGDRVIFLESIRSWYSSSLSLSPCICRSRDTYCVSG